jgi:hypothetical protein
MENESENTARSMIAVGLSDRMRTINDQLGPTITPPVETAPGVSEEDDEG